MNFKDRLREYESLLPLGNSVSYTEAEKRASKFLEAMALVSSWKHEFSRELIGATSVQSVTYHNEFAKAAAKNVTENKLIAEASNDFIKSREDCEGLENDISCLKAYYDIFNNAHIFYRNLAKGEQ